MSVRQNLVRMPMRVEIDTTIGSSRGANRAGGTLFLEPVSRLAHRDEMTRLRRVRLQLVAQPGDVLIHRARRDAEAIAPDLPHQSLTRNDVPAGVDEERQKIELHRAQLDGFSSASDGSRSQVYDDIGEAMMRESRAIASERSPGGR